MLLISLDSLFGPNNEVNTIKLRDHFNSPHIFQERPSAVDEFVRSFSRQAIQKFDSFVTDDLSNHLFQVCALYHCELSMKIIRLRNNSNEKPILAIMFCYVN